MTIRIMDTEDEGLRDRLFDAVVAANGTHQNADAIVNAILATIPAVDDAAVERVAAVINPHPNWINGYNGKQKIRARAKARAAIAAIGKAE